MEERSEIVRHLCQCLYYVKSVSHEQCGVGMDTGNIMNFENVKFSLSCTFFFFFLNVSPHGCRVQTLLCICKILSVLENNCPFFTYHSLWRQFSLSCLIIFQSTRTAFSSKMNYIDPKMRINETLGLQQLRTLQFTSILWLGGGEKCLDIIRYSSFLFRESRGVEG